MAAEIKAVLPVIYAGNGLKVGQGDNRMRKAIRDPISVFHAERVNPPKGSINGTNLQNIVLLPIITNMRGALRGVEPPVEGVAQDREAGCSEGETSPFCTFLSRSTIRKKRANTSYIEAAKTVIKDEGLNARQKFATIILGKMEGIPQRQEIIEELHQDGNAAFHQKSLTETILALSPILAEAVKQGISEGVFDTPCPLETVELLLTASQFLFDRGIFSWTNDDILRRAEAFIYNTELLLGAEHGSFAYLKAAFSTDWENPIE
jgi:hypothetical protein